jgi:hypothetical protein
MPMGAVLFLRIGHAVALVVTAIAAANHDIAATILGCYTAYQCDRLADQIEQKLREKREKVIEFPKMFIDKK